MKRILLVGEMTPGQLGAFCLRGLQGLNVAVATFDMAGYPFASWRASSIPVLPDISHWIERKWVNAFLPRKIKRFKPDIVLILGGRQFTVNTLTKIKAQTDAKLVNWNPDSPWEQHNSSADLLESIPIYDAHFTWGKFLIERFQQAGAQKIHYLPFAYDPILHKPVANNTNAAVVFAGTWDKPRETMLQGIDASQLELWGNHWHRLASDSPLRTCVRGVAEGDKLAPILSNAQITLNFTRAQNGPAHNMRTYEAPACGAFMLGTDTEEHRSLFVAGETADFFTSQAELLEKLDYYLQRPDLCKTISANAHAFITGGNNTYQDRMQTILQYLDNE